MEANCYSCHSAENAPINGGFYNLQDTSTLKEAVLSGELISAIKHDSQQIPFMPQGGAKLPDCDINKFIRWKNEGTPIN